MAIDELNKKPRGPNLTTKSVGKLAKLYHLKLDNINAQCATDTIFVLSNKVRQNNRTVK